jgi:hypothetical protein
VLSVVETPLLTFSLATDPFAEADEDTGETKQSQNYIHIRIQRTYLLFSAAQPIIPLLPRLSEAADR